MSARGVETDSDKLEAVKSWPEPVNAKKIKITLGFTGYYRRFVKDYARIVKPLNDILIGLPTFSIINTDSKNKKKKKVSIPWQWGEVEQHAFDTVKKSCCHLQFLLILILQNHLFYILMHRQTD